MKKNAKLAALTAATALIAGAGLAQGQQGQGGGSASGGGQPGGLHYREGALLGTPGEGLAMQPGQSQVLFRAGQLIGVDASTPQGQKLGQLEEIVFHPQIGTFAVLNLPNGRTVPLPWELLDAVTRDGLVFNTTQQAMNSAPTITGGQWANFNSPAFTQQIYSYFGVEQQEQGFAQSGMGQQQSGAMEGSVRQSQRFPSRAQGGMQEFSQQGGFGRGGSEQAEFEQQEQQRFQSAPQRQGQRSSSRQRYQQQFEDQQWQEQQRSSRQQFRQQPQDFEWHGQSTRSRQQFRQQSPDFESQQWQEQSPYQKQQFRGEDRNRGRQQRQNLERQDRQEFEDDQGHERQEFGGGFEAEF